MKIMVTGGSGFLGSHLIGRLDSHNVSVLGRNQPKLAKLAAFFSGVIDSHSSYGLALLNNTVIIHCAARVHIMDDESEDPLDDYREVNTAGTLNLARQAVVAGVQRFIFISSIKVNGEATELGHPFKSTDKRSPEDFYGQSKSEAEEQLLQLAQETGLEVVIIRPTLVYGPGVKANFASLLNLVSKGLPLPFGCIKHNKRSLVSVQNLVDLIVTCIDHPKAPNQVFLVSDDHDVSTASMVNHMSQALGKSSRLLPVPLWCYRLVGKLTGKTDVVDRLIGSLQVDISHTKDTLGWVPPQTLEQGFKETAEAFILNKNK
ncbi:UDP-glucose 4-epimerase [Shewanella algicola]|uniref:SDR family oxidoreductase n=1 Tax=Shewanella algicola TaxID=640633 RepID=A0A9X1Z5U7_9GAMM|nr:SDR family oxidoreductase [Shewanella algicola]MCL1106158.1 SDR family oxidoreductase [Shewanella algicola]GGP57795.1 UDP-glucose 4-epimerase [Shewanella algicola]